MRNLIDYLGKEVTVTIDRPAGSKHPVHNTYYPINYGFIAGTVSGDGEEVDAYILGISMPVKEFTGKVIAVIERENDAEDKLVVAPKNLTYDVQSIRQQTDFQEKYFKIKIIPLI